MTAPTALLMLPGLMCDERTFASQVAALAGHCRPIALPGYGGARDLGIMAERVLGIAPPRFALLGHSMGARVALEVVRRAPERVERLALLDTGTHLPGPGEAEKRYALLDLGRRDGIAALIDAWLPPMVHPVRLADAALMDPMRAMCMAGGVDRFADQVAALLARPEVDSLLPAIRCPVLVGVGRQDAWSPPDQHERIAAAVPHARLVIFEDCGHMSPLEAPAAVTAAIIDWLGWEKAA